MPYSRILSLCILASLLALAFAGLVTPDWWVQTVVNLICLVILVVVAMRYQRSKRPGFDPVVAAETIVAFGVTSLILSLVGATLQLLRPNGLDFLTSGGRLVRVAEPFVGGLLAAGVAPLGAMFLRNDVSEQDTQADPASESAAAARAMAGLAREVVTAQRGMTDLQASLGLAVLATTELATSLQGESTRLKQQLQDVHEGFAGLIGAVRGAGDEVNGAGLQVGEQLRSAGIHAAEGLRTAATAAAESVVAASQRASEGVAGASVRAAEEVLAAGNQAGQVIRDLGVGVGVVADEALRCSESLSGVGALLQEVERLTEQVKRFVEPLTLRKAG